MSTVKIMVIGDSLSDAPVWRFEYVKQLLAAGADFEMVGSLRAESALFDSLPEPERYRFSCAKGGYSVGPDNNDVGNVAGKLDEYLDREFDLIEIMIGVNDYFGKGAQDKEILNNYWNMLARIYEKSPNAIVFCASPPPRKDPAFCPARYPGNLCEVLPAIVNGFCADGRRCFYINMDEAGVAPTDFSDMDDTHPMDSGYRKIASTWFNHTWDTVLRLNSGEEIAVKKITAADKIFRGVKNF